MAPARASQNNWTAETADSTKKNLLVQYVYKLRIIQRKKFTHNLENCSSKIQQSYKHDYENNNGQKFFEKIFNF